jgi:hypothetical protein
MDGPQAGAHPSVQQSLGRCDHPHLERSVDPQPPELGGRARKLAAGHPPATATRSSPGRREDRRVRGYPTKAERWAKQRRHRLAAAGLTEQQWRQRWTAERLFLAANGEADKPRGNETIRWHPEQGWLELKLPTPLAHPANRRHGRYRLSWAVGFTYRGDEVAAQPGGGAVR